VKKSSSTICAKNSVRDFVFPMFRANTCMKAKYLSALRSRVRSLPNRLNRDGQDDRATAISHGATGKGNDQSAASTFGATR